MSVPSRRQLAGLRRLARLFEVQPSFVGTDGRRVTASPETLLLVLRSLGAEAESLADAKAACKARLRGTWLRRLDPVAVAWQGRPAEALLRFARSDLAPFYDCWMRLESGEVLRWRHECDERTLRSGPVVDGRDTVELPLSLPAPLPLGYHRLEVEVAGELQPATVISAPRRAYAGAGEERDWGVFLPLYSLHSAKSQGIGDFSDLGRLAEWAAEQGASFVGTLPLLAAFLDEPFEPSPYAPVSRLFWNEVYVDTGESTLPPTQGRTVDYRAVMASKRRVLAGRARDFFQQGGSGDFTAYIEARPEVEDYARFRAAGERLGPRWREWPVEARRGHLDPSQFDEDVARYYIYAQWQAHRQVSAVAGRDRSPGSGAELYLDLPVGVHADGYDAWRYQDVFAEHMSVGAPPDPLTTTGQDWGFAPLLPDALRRTGYEYMARYLRHNLSLGGLLRIDHIFGMYRLYCLSGGASAREGVYIRYRTDEMFAVLCLESHRGGTRVIGEDIGITPPGFREAMRRRGVGRLYVLTGSIARDAATPIVPIPEGAMASFGTHDLPPFASFWAGDDLEARTRLGVLDASMLRESQERRLVEKQVLAAHLKGLGLLAGPAGAGSAMLATEAMLAQSAAGHVMVNLEDAWLETESQNVPGTSSDTRPNWTRRARLSLEEIERDEGVRETLALVREARRPEPTRRPRRSGRS